MTSMMAPSLIQKSDGTLVALGSGGSNRIRTALVQVIVNLIDFGMDVESAVVGPRIHLEGERLSAEDGFADEDLQRLLAEYPDHESWPGRNLFFGGAHTVTVKNGVFVGSGDPRRGGVCRQIS
jgi:gamma-glutamyltranspeptidase/glutathione hydrolase